MKTWRDRKRVLYLFSGRVHTGEFPVEHTVDINSDLDPTFTAYDLLMCREATSERKN